MTKNCRLNYLPHYKIEIFYSETELIIPLVEISTLFSGLPNINFYKTANSFPIFGRLLQRSRVNMNLTLKQL